MTGTPWPLGETAIRLRAGEPVVDAMGQEIPGPDTETPVVGCAVWPRTSDEREQSRAQVVTGLTLFVPVGADVRATDRFRVRGEVYQVEGEPGFWSSPLTGHAVGTEVALTRVTG